MEVFIASVLAVLGFVLLGAFYYVAIPFAIVAVLSFFGISMGYWTALAITILFYLLVSVVKRL